eukprot:1010881-Prymnesium_polylepis.2
MLPDICVYSKNRCETALTGGRAGRVCGQQATCGPSRDGRNASGGRARRVCCPRATSGPGTAKKAASGRAGRAPSRRATCGTSRCKRAAPARRPATEGCPRATCRPIPDTRASSGRRALGELGGQAVRERVVDQIQPLNLPGTRAADAVPCGAIQLAIVHAAAGAWLSSPACTVRVLIERDERDGVRARFAIQLYYHSTTSGQRKIVNLSSGGRMHAKTAS